MELADYIPLETEIIIFSDYKTFLQNEKKIKLPGVKIGNGVNTVIELPFIAAEDELHNLEELEKHIQDDTRHLIEGEREKINNNVSVSIDEKTLILTRNYEV